MERPALTIGCGVRRSCCPRSGRFGEELSAGGAADRGDGGVDAVGARQLGGWRRTRGRGRRGGGTVELDGDGDALAPDDSELVQVVVEGLHWHEKTRDFSRVFRVPPRGVEPLSSG